jgi:hypothetical protein
MESAFMADLPELSTWDDGSSVCDNDESSDDDSNDDNSQEISTVPEVVLVPISKESTGPKGKLTLYWALATEDEKSDQDRRDFQRVKDRSEDLRLDGELARQKKKLLDREKTRLRVQNFRDRAREKKIEEGWIPGQKRVTVHFDKSGWWSNSNLFLLLRSMPRA